MKNHTEKYVIEEAFLKRCTDNCNGIIIYGIGEYGKKTVDYFSSTGKKEKLKAILVTDRTCSESEYAGISVIESRMFFKCEENRQHCMRGGGYCVIVAVSLKYQGEIAMILEGYGVEQYYCITRSVLRELEKKVNIETDHRVCEPYRGMDFIIAGFTKCGTTSMHYALNKIPGIYLPTGKETKFFSWFHQVPDAKNKLIEKYFMGIREGQKVGTIDPTFYGNAKEIYQFFGSDIKLVFMIRNPVDATFSLYKMLNRDGDPLFEQLYQKYAVYHKNMFLKYFESVVSKENYQFHYDYWLEKFLMYFSREQIKVILFENLIKDPVKEINDLLDFIGVDERYQANAFPKENAAASQRVGTK